jgi:hypothetical protein
MMQNTWQRGILKDGLYIVFRTDQETNDTWFDARHVLASPKDSLIFNVRQTLAGIMLARALGVRFEYFEGTYFLHAMMGQEVPGFDWDPAIKKGGVVLIGPDDLFVERKKFVLASSMPPFSPCSQG